MTTRSFSARSWLPLLILFLASALTYLPFVPQIGFSNDDWYLVYGAHVRGPDYFAPAFDRDRPLRALILAPEYSLFGDDPLPYHLTLYAFRFLSAVSLLWLLNQLWPARNREKRQPTVSHLLTALLFLLYPGFLSQPNPVDYQAQIIALCAATASLALTVTALQTPRRALKIVSIILSFLLTWLYLGLIEYYIGLEVLRLACVYLVTRRKMDTDTRTHVDTYTGTQGTRTPHLVSRIPHLVSSIKPILLASIPFLLAPLTFLVWRLFFFTSERNATDAGLQLGLLFSSPTTGLWWLARFMQDIVNVIFLAWGTPLYHLAFNLRLSETWIGFALAGAVAVGTIIILAKSETGIPKDDRAELLWVGLVSAAAGLIPVILVNRHVEFFSLSRYTLASSVGAAMFVAAALEYLASTRLRLTLAGLLIAASVLTHFANGAAYARDTQTMRQFWWQVSWRAPNLREGATLALFYPAPLQEDYFIWGAANLIYHPEPQASDPIEAPIGGVLLTPENLTRILSGKGADEPDRRNIHVTLDYGNTLIITQPAPGACVRVLDGAQPELSARDDPRILLAASASKIQNVNAGGSHPPMNEFVFGAEPEHDWCWYYQQAALARQRGEWALVASLGDSALERGFYPNDSVEWIPFMQAYAILGRGKDLKQLSSIFGAEPFLEQQACAILTRMADQKMLTPDMAASAMQWYCGQ
ncbi:MAG: hypothetical protein HFACDABA_02104 [Anaerolineales bacterium]|nr:hypothetical protein [Anaerolineales bacterium]